MDRNNRRSGEHASHALGIVVQNGRPTVSRTRTLGFIWGMGMNVAPSLPFGRWKVPAGSAA